MFRHAEPIFLTGLNRTRDVQAGFYLPLPPADGRRVKLRCAAATFYRAYLNGELLCHGPARAAHGYARVDEIDLTARLRHGVVNHLAIEVASYHLDCIYTTGDAGFLMAEVVSDDAVVAWTSEQTHALRLTQRQPAERFSHARVTGEVYVVDAAFFDWRLGRIDDACRHAVERVTGPAHLLPRGVPQPDYTRHAAGIVLGVHSFDRDPAVRVPAIAPLEVGPYLDFVATLPERPALECASETVVPLRGRLETAGTPVARFSDAVGRFGIDLDFGTLRVGFLGVDVDTDAGATLDLVFVDTLGEHGEINARSGDMNGVIRLHLPGGRVPFDTFEPHCFRYVRLIFGGTTTATVHGVTAIDYAYPDRPVPALDSGDAELDAIDAAARLTLRLNTLDIFMDCPGRERAGWLCDSLFTARAMHRIYGDASVERAMLENFLHAPESGSAPGYFPECYPARAIEGGNFIPNWSMFLGLQLAEYVRRTGDTALRDAYRERIVRLVEGILESWSDHTLLANLPGFTFIDWSDANRDDYKRPVSVPTNALFEAMLRALADLYDRPSWKSIAGYVRKCLRHHAPTDGPMADALVPDGDTLRPGPHASEAAQYYLFWTGTLDAHGDHRAAWERLRDAYGPAPTRPDSGPPLAPSNVFIGLYLRFDLLARLGERDRLLREMKALFGPMLTRGPGTLWEHRTLAGSVCHGFASHAAVWLRDCDQGQ